MQVVKYPKRSEWENLLSRPLIDNDSLDIIVKEVFDDIKKNGDKAVIKYTSKFDKVDLTEVKVTDKEIADAEKLVDNNLKEAIKLAASNIEKFHKIQVLKTEYIETQKGVKCWQESRPIEKVGLYIPGGTAPLFSTVLMLAVPAKIAGCNEIVLCTPPSKDGTVHPAILFAANLVGVTAIYKIGGIQSIAAMTYGTESVTKVYKIFGPGNQYVTAAKQIAARGSVAIDMPAGPSEVAVIADNTSNPVYVAADLLSQAEHGIDSQSILITYDENIVSEILKEIDKQLDVLPRKEIAKISLKASKILLVKDIDEAIDIANEYAAEHLIIATKDYLKVSSKINNAGSIFLGNYACESAGDYASGTNHTLPTNGYARNYSGVNLDAFVKKITFQELTQEGVKNIGPSIELMANEEQLQAHKNAMTVRLNDLK